jgi:tetratricopeptide (TPR) repeat protein
MGLGLLAKSRGDLAGAGSEFAAARNAFSSIGRHADVPTATGQLAGVSLHAGREVEAEALYREAAEGARRYGRRINAALNEVNRALAALFLGRVDGIEEALAKQRRVLELEGQRDLAAQAGVVIGEARYARGDLSGATRIVEESMTRLRDSRVLSALATALTSHSVLLAAAGRLSESLDALREARETAAEAGDETAPARICAQEAHVLFLAGAADRALARAGEAVEIALRCADIQTVRLCGLLLAEDVLLGFPASVAGPWMTSLEATLGDAAGAFPAVRAAALAFASEAGRDDGALRAGAQAIAAGTLYLRRAECRVLGAWLDAEARRRQDGSAPGVGQEALRLASSLGHMGLQAALCRYLLKLPSRTTTLEDLKRLLGTMEPLLGPAVDPSLWRAAWGVH